MKKYAYHVVTGDSDFINEKLDKLGEEGWELVSVIYLPRVIYGWSFLYFGEIKAYFKKDL